MWPPKTGYRQKATGQKATGLKATDKRPQDRRPLRQATERNVKMLPSCQDVLKRLRVVLKTVEQIVLYVSSVLVCRPSLFVVYFSSYLFLQPLKLASLNLLHNLGLGSSLPRKLLGQKLAEVWAREHLKYFAPPTSFCNR